MQTADDKFRAQYGRGMTTDANGVSNDTAYNDFTSKAMATDYQTQADALARTKRNWNRVRNTAYAAEAVAATLAALPAAGAVAYNPAWGAGMLPANTAGTAAAAAAAAAPTAGITLGTGGATMPTLGAPAGLATGAGGTTAPVAPVAGKGIASLLGKPGVTPAIINSGAALLQQRSQNKATNEATRLTLAGNAEALKLQREQLEAETRNADLDREDLRAQNAAINELKRRELAAAEEVRAFDREQALYLRSRNETEDRRLAAQEVRREPYRQAGQASLSRLMSMWGM